MPSPVRMFFWIVFCVQTYLIASMVWVVETHPGHNISNLPGTAFAILYSTFFLSWFIPSILAWLAAFRRQNWARWLFAALFACGLLLQLSFFVFFTPKGWVSHHLQTTLFDLKEITTDILSIIAIFFVFTGNARTWFAKAA